MKEIGVTGQYNGQQRKYTFIDSDVYFIEADTTKDRELLKLAGLELTGAGIDQADEVERLAFSILQVRTGRENKNKAERSTGKIMDVPRFILLTTNPTQNWLKEEFYTPQKEGKLKAPYFYLPALPTENPHNTEDYIEGLKDLPEAQRRQYLYGDWNYADDPNQLINYAWITNCITEEEYLQDNDKVRFMGIDVARYGDDTTVMVFMQDNEVYDIKAYKHQDTVKTAELAEYEATDQRIGYEHVGVDVVGLGAGVVDTMTSKGLRVTEFNSAETPQSEQGYFKFANKRAEAYWLLREDLKNGNMAINVNIKTGEILKQLTQMRYYTKGDKIYIESKDDIKKRLGRSPDEADALTIANYMRHYSNAGGLILDEQQPAFEMPKVRVLNNF